MDNQFQLLDTIIKSRLLSFNDDGYEDILDMEVDSFRKRYKDVSDEKLEPIMENFTEAFEGFDAFGPGYMVDSYIKASDVYNSKDFEWGSNKHLAKRKKFCLWMFKQAYMNNPDLHNDPYTPKKEDWDLLRLFKPDPEDTREDIDIVFTMLLTFQVIRPFDSESIRALQYNSPAKSNEKMIELLELLHHDLPAFGVIKTLHSIEHALNVLRDERHKEYPLPPAALWGMLNNVSCDLEVNSSPAELLDSHVETDGYVMRGIWVDDAKNNQNRFWVFPNNKLMAFCFYLKNGEWILNPYEFVFTKLEHEYEFDNICLMATAKGNEQAITSGKINEEELVRLKYELGDRDEEGRFQTIRFELESGSDYPYWMNWRSFRRLPFDHQLAKEYKAIIDKIYNGSEMLRCCDYRNIGSWVTDSPDCLVCLDSEFLYLSDIALEKNGYLELINAGEDYPLYDYYVRFAKKDPVFNIFGLEISEDQPMYVISRNPMFYAGLDETLNRKSLVKVFHNREERNAFLRRYEDFKETVMGTEFSDQLTIYKNLRGNFPAILCFNKISRTFIIDEILEWFGVRKFTSREAMVKSNLFN